MRPRGCWDILHGAAGRLAQLGERQLDKLEVTGSSPVPPTAPTRGTTWRASVAWLHPLRQSCREVFTTEVGHAWHDVIVVGASAGGSRPCGASPATCRVTFRPPCSPRCTCPRRRPAACRRSSTVPVPCPPRMRGRPGPRARHAPGRPSGPPPARRGRSGAAGAGPAGERPPTGRRPAVPVGGTRLRPPRRGRHPVRRAGRRQLGPGRRQARGVTVAQDPEGALY